MKQKYWAGQNVQIANGGQKMTDLKEILKHRCKIALLTIDAVSKMQESNIVLRVLQSVREKTETFQDELNNPDLTKERALELNAQFVTAVEALGQDLIAYGALLSPAANSN